MPYMLKNLAAIVIVHSEINLVLRSNLFFLVNRLRMFPTDTKRLTDIIDH